MDKRIDEFSGLKGVQPCSLMSKDFLFIFLWLIHDLFFFFLLVYSKHKPAIKSKLFRKYTIENIPTINNTCRFTV